MSKEDDLKLWRDALENSNVDSNNGSVSDKDGGYNLQEVHHRRVDREKDKQIRKAARAKKTGKLSKAAKIAIIIASFFGVVLIVNAIIYGYLLEKNCLPDSAYLMLILPMVYFIQSLIITFVLILARNDSEVPHDPADEAMSEYRRNNRK